MDIATLAMAKAYADSKYGYTEKKVILPETAVVAEGDGTEIPCEGTPIVIGNKYIVTFNGVQYERTAFLFENYACPAIGEYTETCPFIVLCPNEGLIVAIALEDGTISVTGETIHPIDQKFIPGAVLPVVEITSTAMPESGTVELTADEAAQIEAAIATGMPAVIKIICNEMPACIVGQLLATGYCFMPPAGNGWMAVAVEEGKALIGVVE